MSTHCSYKIAKIGQRQIIDKCLLKTVYIIILVTAHLESTSTVDIKKITFCTYVAQLVIDVQL